MKDSRRLISVPQNFLNALLSVKVNWLPFYSCLPSNVKVSDQLTLKLLPMKT